MRNNILRVSDDLWTRAVYFPAAPMVLEYLFIDRNLGAVTVTKEKEMSIATPNTSRKRYRLGKLLRYDAIYLQKLNYGRRPPPICFTRNIITPLNRLARNNERPEK